MPKSYRIRTSVDGLQDSEKTIRVQVDQDFDFLEVLSLKLTQSDVYDRFCADYGVVVGRVVANGGFGVPNAKVSVFVPLDAIDETDPIISTLYPYKDVTEKNEDGFRYNLLPYTPSYEGHVPTGTFPTREDVLTRKEVLQIYEKYYKYTVKTNDSGDYMIVGVPLGNQRIFLDVDLSDMGCFSQRPTDLIRIGKATEKQFNGNQFKSSSDLGSLPQLVTQVKNISVSSFWGAGGACDVGITRVDFDLRDSNVNIEPVATFMGSIMSSGKNAFIKNTCKVMSEQGDLCGMIASPGRILAIRQTINSDRNGDPILEQYQLEQGGKVIDENGAFVVDVPMNLDYVTTNEFGEQVLSNDPRVGIPTSGKYRFKIKWEDGEQELGAIQNSDSLISSRLINLQPLNSKGSLVRANYLLPNIKEYGWTAANSDPSSNEGNRFSQSFSNETQETQEWVSTSYASNTTIFLDNIDGEYQSLVLYREVTPNSNNFEIVNSRWIDLPQGGKVKVVINKRKKSITFNSGTRNLQTYRTVKLNFQELDYTYALFQKSYSFSLNWNDYPDKDEAISCRDFFYKFNYNKVYTTAQLIDEYRGGSSNGNARGNFLSIKEILDRSCEGEINKFPINDGVRNFDLLYFIISILFLLLTIVGGIILINYHLIKWLWNNFAPFVLTAIIGVALKNSAQEFVASAQAFIGSSLSFGATALLAIPFFSKGLLWLAFAGTMIAFFKQITKFKFPSLKLPMITYPDCSACDCDKDNSTTFSVDYTQGDFNISPLADINQPGVYNQCNPGGYDVDGQFAQYYRLGLGQITAGRDDVDDKNFARTAYYNLSGDKYTWWSNYNLPLPERINVYNTKGHYFSKGAGGGGGTNKIKVFPNYKYNEIGTIISPKQKHYYDQPLIFLADADQLSNFQTGGLLSFINPNNTKDVNILSASTVQNGLGTFSVTGTTIPSGNTSINITYANPDNPNSEITTNFRILQNLYPQEQASYLFPSDIEYYQVVTATTVSTVENLVKGKSVNESSFYKRVIDGKVDGRFYYKDEVEGRSTGTITGGKVSCVENYSNLVVVILMKGVDPYTTRQDTKIDISLPLGLNEGSVIVESKYKLNIPIQKGLGLEKYDTITSNASTSIFYNSYVFTPSTGTGLFKFSGYTTNNHRYYSSFDKNNDNLSLGVQTTDGYYSVGAKGNVYTFGGYKGPNNIVGISDTYNGYYDYEYVEGGSLMWSSANPYPVNKNAGQHSYQRSVYVETGNTLNISNSTKIVMRTDRLPRSDQFDNDFVFAQNKSFGFYFVTDNGVGVQVQATINTTSDFTTQQGVGFEEAYGSGTTSVMTSFSCSNMVPLGAYYQAPGNSIQLLPPQDSVYYTAGDTNYPIMENGCYRLVEKDLAIGADLKSFSEWKSRFLFGFALCRNVFGMTFTNQWINGVLYMPGFQNDKVYVGLDTKFPRYNFCRQKIMFREENNSFFYRSSPYNINTQSFVGMDSGVSSDKGSNGLFLGNPTTIVDLGPKDSIVKNICPKPEFQGYNISRLDATTYKNIGDLMQFFAISRLSNARFIDKIPLLGIGQMFSRKGQKIDGDLAQLTSINSELGIVPFSPESYTDNSLYFDALPEAVVGVFFTGDTTPRDLITPGREIFIDTPNKFAYNYFGFNSQTVPMYKWGLKQKGTGSLFGSEENSWVTTSASKFKVIQYQGIDRLSDGTYFSSSIIHPTTQRPGYIYNSTALSASTGEITGYTYNGQPNTSPSEFMVGAPFHFYFGLKAGKTAYDIFLKKNLIDI